jgi:hypothetical protein
MELPAQSFQVWSSRLVPTRQKNGLSAEKVVGAIVQANQIIEQLAIGVDQAAAVAAKCLISCDVGGVVRFGPLVLAVLVAERGPIHAMQQGDGFCAAGKPPIELAPSLQDFPMLRQLDMHDVAITTHAPHLHALRCPPHFEARPFFRRHAGRLAIQTAGAMKERGDFVPGHARITSRACIDISRGSIESRGACSGNRLRSD